MKIAMTGSSGLVGAALIESFHDHQVLRLVRSKPENDEQSYWNPQTGEIDTESLEGVDVVIHLAGENISAGRWTPAMKNRIRESRVFGTSLLAQTLAKLKSPPRLFISASAIGFYGDRGLEEMTEKSLVGPKFLADVCRLWEDATAPAEERGIATIHLRLGVVISARGGLLTRLLLPFKMGVGGKVGSGKQFMSWISIDDVVGIVNFLIANSDIKGPVNAVAPNPVTNLEFTRTLGAALRRPTILPMPAVAAKLAFGDMADELLLSSTRVVPTILQSAGYQFKHPTVDVALRDALAKNKRSHSHH